MDLARQAVKAINETYKTGDLLPWRQHVEEAFDPEIVLEAAPTGAFTEGEWSGHEGVVGFVANQMEVLEDMWLRADDYIEVDDECLIVAITFGGRARHTGIDVELSPPTSSGCATGGRFGGRYFKTASKPSKPPGCRSRALTRGPAHFRRGSLSLRLGTQLGPAGIAPSKTAEVRPQRAVGCLRAGLDAR